MKTSHENIINGFNFDELAITITYVAKIESKEWPHYLWHVGIKAPNGETYSIDYKTNLGLVKKQTKLHYLTNMPKNPLKPTNSDIVYSLFSDSDAGNETFEDFCSAYGYDEDSRKAMNIYLACQQNAKVVNRCFSAKQIEDMREALQDYWFLACKFDAHGSIYS